MKCIINTVAVIACLFMFNTYAGNGGGKHPPSIQTPCQSFVEHEVNKGVRLFTKEIIERMAVSLLDRENVRDMSAGKQCIIKHLVKLKVPYEQ